jgi:class 3 adenylate cyclase
MNPDPPASGSTRSQRSLAAIVFTDVVSFSARMHSDEVGTLKLLQRDFTEMRRICAEHEGEVLKTTGDGLLLTFTSAVQAVACALAMQRQFAAEAKDQAQAGALQHRIGIHLGDVLVQDKDVMGDGVNIASRLQAEAEPGGICISQTVYDVVKNKLEMKVVSLGARDLKNISQAMPVYRLLLEAQTLDPSSPAGLRAAQGPGARTRRRVLTAIGAAVALAAVLAATAIFTRRNHGNSNAAAAAAPPAAAPAVVPPTPAPANAVAGGAAANDLASNLASESAKRKDVIQQMHALYLDKYDFAGLVLALRDKGESPTAPLNLQQMLRTAEQLVRMKGWLDVTLGRYGPQRPLVVHDLSGDSTKDVSVYLAPDQRLVYLENGSSKARDWTDLKPAEFGAVIVAAERESKETPHAAAMGALAFARLYALPSMTEALNAIKARREKAAAPK